jgi:hypothetical protein
MACYNRNQAQGQHLIKLGKHNSRTLSLVIKGRDSKQLYSLHNSPISTSCGVHDNRCPSFCTQNYQPNTCDRFLLSITSPHHPPSVSTHILYDEWLVCHLKGYLLDIKFIRKVTLSLGLLSHSTPSFSGIRVVRKFYWIWVWNVDTQHLMHKVRVKL